MAPVSISIGVSILIMNDDHHWSQYLKCFVKSHWLLSTYQIALVSVASVYNCCLDKSNFLCYEMKSQFSCQQQSHGENNGIIFYIF